MAARRLVVASEYGEPSKYEEIICQRLRAKRGDICLLLITKYLPGCLSILDVAEELKVPTQIHCTITGLGGTKLEPHIPTSKLMVEESLRAVEKYKIDPKSVTVRIDPIVPEFQELQVEEASHTLEAFASVGVRDCRISIVDYYPHVRERFDKLGICHPRGFQPPSSTKELIITHLLHLTCQFNMELHLCAETVPKGLASSIDIDTEGCASAVSWERLGITNLRPATRKQRRECTCDREKTDLLAGLSKGCTGGCAYCYWRH